MLERAHGRVPIIGVINTAGSLLAEQADAPLLTRAGSEYSASSKTNLATLAGLAWLGDALTTNEPLPTQAVLVYESTPRMYLLYLLSPGSLVRSWKSSLPR